MGGAQTGLEAAYELPTTLDAITPGLLTAVLGGRFTGVEVADLRIGDARSGTSTSVPVTLDYARNGAGLPGRMYLKASFVKHGFSSGDLTAMEARFYEELAATLAGPVNLPQGYRGLVDGLGRSLVLTEDLSARGVRFGEATEPATVDEVAHGIEQLAAMHARYWGAAGLERYPWLNAVADIAAVMRYLVTPPIFDRYIGRLDTSVLDRLADRDVVANALERMFATDAVLPHTLVHGDPHLGNTYREADGRPGFLDWQFVGIGPFIWDVSYYLTGALDPADRRASERDLLALYRDRLRTLGAEPPDPADIWLAHRRHMIHGFLSLLTPEDSQPESFAVAMGTRFAIAAAELDTVSALEHE